MFWDMLYTNLITHTEGIQEDGGVIDIGWTIVPVQDVLGGSYRSFPLHRIDIMTDLVIGMPIQITDGTTIQLMMTTYNMKSATLYQTVTTTTILILEEAMLLTTASLTMSLVPFDNQLLKFHYTIT